MKKNNIIIVRIWEGLGNQLFQYAYARMMKEKGYDVRLDLNKAYDDTFTKYKYDDIRQNCIQKFNITLPEINVEKYEKYNYINRNNMKNKIVFYLATHGLWKYKYFEESIPQNIKKALCLKGNYYIRSWFQDERYFKQIRNILLKELTPKKKIQISEDLHQALEYKESVSLHVRRGDYVRARRALKASYYEKAVALIKKRYQNPLFLIFSEDLEWARNNLNIGENCIYVNENRKLQDYEELLIMSKCKSNIISNSTFSWWAAWLNRNPEKIVIVPRNLWRPKQMNIIPKGWVRI